MKKYISLLRGINVGGHKKIKMDDLKSLYESLGFKNVVTFIQSGNVIFEAAVKIIADMKVKIEKAIEETYQFFVYVEIRTHYDIELLINNNPFGTINMAENATKVSVIFLFSQPLEVNVSDIQRHVVAPEKLVVRGKEVYIYSPIGFGKSKLTNTFLERKLGVKATARNWKTVCELYKLFLE